MKRYRCFFLFAFVMLPLIGLSEVDSQIKETDSTALYNVEFTDDFIVTGEGNATNWQKASWMHLIQSTRHNADVSRTTKVKILYSQTGIYFLFYCQDEKLTATMDSDFMDLWKEDVVEVFLLPDENQPAYFEYELSPLNYELAIIVSNIEGELYRWKPFHYESDRKPRHATAVRGGKKESFGDISAYTAEFFIPYRLLRPLNNISPKPGTRWRANFYRIDYDKERVQWSWQPTEKTNHEYKKFGTLYFK